MKIAFFVDAFPAPSTTFIMNQINGMIRKGHEVDVYATYRTADKLQCTGSVCSDVEARCRFLFETPRRLLPRILTVAGMCFRAGLWRQPRVVLACLNVFRYGKDAVSLRMLNAASVLRGTDYDVIHCQFGTLGPLVLEFKHMGVLQGTLATSFRGYDATQYLKRHPGCYTQLFTVGDVFLPVSASLKRCIEKEGCPTERIKILPSGIDTERFSYVKRQLESGEPVHVVSVARLTEKKGLEYAIRAIARLVRSLNRPLIYSIAGDGELKDSLEQLILELGVSDVVRLLGWKSPGEIADLLDQGHILMAPSITAANGDQEGIPNVLKEAMAKGMPVLATLHSGIPELVEDGVSGYLVPERDAGALSEKLFFMIEHPEHWGAMGKAGRERVLEDYDNQRINDQLDCIYQGLGKET